MLSKTEFINKFEQDRLTDESNTEDVKKIIQDVKEHQDQALFRYNKKFDNVDLEQLEVPQYDIKNSINLISDTLRSALEQALNKLKISNKKLSMKM